MPYCIWDPKRDPNLENCSDPGRKIVDGFLVVLKVIVRQTHLIKGLGLGFRGLGFIVV